MHKHFPKFIPKIQKYPKNHQKSWNFEQNYIIFSKFPPQNQNFLKNKISPQKSPKLSKKSPKLFFSKFPKKCQNFPEHTKLLKKSSKLSKNIWKLSKISQTFQKNLKLSQKKNRISRTNLQNYQKIIQILKIWTKFLTFPIFFKKSTISPKKH